MSTRATIRFKDQFDEFYVYRGHDGYPEIIVKDIEVVIEAKKRSWSGSECGLLATCFMAWHFDKTQRLPRYELTKNFHGDESYTYFVDWDNELKKWTVTFADDVEDDE